MPSCCPFFDPRSRILDGERDFKKRRTQPQLPDSRRDDLSPGVCLSVRDEVYFTHSPRVLGAEDHSLRDISDIGETGLRAAVSYDRDDSATNQPYRFLEFSLPWSQHIRRPDDRYRKLAPGLEDDTLGLKLAPAVF